MANIYVKEIDDKIYSEYLYYIEEQKKVLNKKGMSISKTTMDKMIVELGIKTFLKEAESGKECGKN